MNDDVNHGADGDELSALIRQHASQHTAGSRLRADIRARIAVEAAAQNVPEKVAVVAVAGQQSAPRSWSRWRYGGIWFALGVACTAAVLSLAPHPMLEHARPVDADALDAELVSDHVRSLRVGPLVQVESTDRHTVKPWFQGKLDYAPPVLNLADEGFPLIGGRVEHINGDSVATLVYMHNKHVLNMFVWPSTAPQDPQKVQRRGFNVLHWSDGAMQYWVVSDMDATEVERFSAAWREQRGKL